jgi:hypothetical protein
MKNTQSPELIETGTGTSEVRFAGISVRISCHKNGPYDYFVLRWKVGRKSFRRSISDRQEAIAEAKRIARDIARGKETATTLHEGDIVFVSELIRKVGGVNHLLSAVELYLRTHNLNGPRKTMNDLCDELEKEMTLREKNDEIAFEHLKNIKYENGVLKKWFGAMTLQQITSELVKTKLLESEYSRTSKRNLLRAEELIRLFIVLRPHQLLYVATMAFGGSRRAEFQRMNAGHFVDEENIACIDADIAKTSARRTLDIPDNLRAWMEVAETPKEGPLVSKKAVVKVS